ncbi:hypothetical protein A2415_00685 [candidate division WWE3 bacterium RIFOXYC1_FULL_39_7]|uniref:Glycosyltransferase RgtA/B/C/D-like domain-containing protein n=2 Tax=Katanobacteria TaxID=422282 RepID=A0A1F4X6T6_UNCKA|nr:MAG: hypothetical protein A2415_00685 [candidate division WWE3 bacterium RIFOXYC1_FULL_39_7]OGC77339.1 MAG: hypothetical protein A2619_04870 [candidate division WWE3 bacterium RIFOXYD1_FULL_39_9]
MHSFKIPGDPIYKVNKSTFVFLCKIALLFLSVNLFFDRSWVGEDAFIFFRYIDNFVNGHGLVFNLNERVEGFTSPLWVFVLSGIRYVTHFPLRPTAILFGVLLSTISIALLIFKDNKHRIFFPIGVVLLVTNSAFRDFATSGFETSQTYILLVILALLIKHGKINKHPFVIGLISSLLILNRPESFLIFMYLAFIYTAGLLTFRNRKLKFDPQAIKKFVLFLLPVIIFVGGYQIFRMGYYASLLPNTFYAKKGGEFYIEQGINYLSDFTKSYPITFIIFLVTLISILINRILRIVEDKYFVGRVHLFLMLFLLSLYVLYAGGDYMHGRSLLMVFILSMILINDFYELILESVADYKGYSLGPYVASGLFILIIFFCVSIFQRPVSVRAGKQLNNINDERSHFGVKFERKKFKQFLMQEITPEFGWKDRGYYYKEVSEAVDLPITVVNWNIGFFGYAAGPDVSVMGSILTDPILARFPIEKRGKIGHENSAHWEYILSRKPTISYTPFTQWNLNAHFKYQDAEHSSVIGDDSNDSFPPILDLSNTEFIERFSKLIGKDIKKSVDDAQHEYLKNLKQEDLKLLKYDAEEYFGFLKVYWYPYANAADKELFNKRRAELFGLDTTSSYEEYIKTSEIKDQQFFEKISGPLTLSDFSRNIVYSITNE